MGAQGRFPSTSWSLVLAAGSGDRRTALEELCTAYWPPVYAFIRHQGHDSESSKDLTQSFFTHLLEKQSLQAARPDRGRFRSFLLTSTKNFLANDRDRAHAQKRGGGLAPLPLEFEDAERRFSLEPADRLTPEKLFERRWALTTLEHALAALRRELEQAGKTDQFAHLKGLLTGGESESGYREIAAALELTEGALKVTVHRLRRRFRELVRAEILQTLRDPADVDDELQYLLAVMRD
jgi:RNA polymerase sigma factor (sigma-70 family)